MLQAYIRGALGRAPCEILEDDGSSYGEVPEFEGVYANAESLEKCREELEEVLEEWVLFRVSKNLPLPTVLESIPPVARSLPLVHHSNDLNCL